MKRNTQKKQEEITRKEALKKIGNYGKYSVLTALGTYLILNPHTAQATSMPDIDMPDDLPGGIGGGGSSSNSF